jgi:hypothetical protein
MRSSVLTVNVKSVPFSGSSSTAVKDGALNNHYKNCVSLNDSSEQSLF